MNGSDSIPLPTRTLDSYYRILDILCPECECGSAYFDESRSEVFCADCGLMLLFNPPYNFSYPALGGAVFNETALKGSAIVKGKGHQNKSNNDYYQDIIRLRRNRERKHGNKREWRRKQYHRYVQIVHNNIGMNPSHKHRAHYIINKIPDFRRLHHRNDYEFTVTAICIYAMEETRNTLVDFSDPFIESLGITPDEFDKISKNITKFLE